MQDHFLPRTSMSRPLKNSCHIPTTWYPFDGETELRKGVFSSKKFMENSAMYKIH